MLSDDVIKQMESKYRGSIKNTKVSNPQLLILFSGPPGCGKSTIAREIENKFRAIRIENDAVRRIIHENEPELSLSELSAKTYNYTNDILSEIIETSPNKLIVMDSSIDRRYADLFEVIKKHNLKYIIISVQLSKHEHKKRINSQKANPFASKQKVLALMKQRREEQKEFLSKHNPDLVVTENTPISKVVSEINKTINNS